MLTGWHNRRYLQSRLLEELARCRRERTPLTCLMIDVDHFKSVNDRFGHLAGDEVLRQLAHCISAEVRGSDVSARYGGEEFVVLLPGTGPPRDSCSPSVSAPPWPPTRSSCPAACARSPSRSRSAWPSTARRSRQLDLKVVGERLLALADVALYEAKAGGRNAVARAANS